MVPPAPGRMAKADIAQNAADLVRALGVPLPKVAVLAAVEAVNPAWRIAGLKLAAGELPPGDSLRDGLLHEAAILRRRVNALLFDWTAIKPSGNTRLVDRRSGTGQTRSAPTTVGVKRV